MKANRKRKRFIRPIAIWLLIFQVAVFFLGKTTAMGGTNHPNSDDHQYASDRDVNVLKILAVLENKIEDQQLLEKTKKKLFTLDDGQTRLIASLSDRVAKEGDTTGASIAFLLMTVLITLL
jgi:hypothetical protein